MIAVIIPAYNRGDLLNGALASLVTQTEKKFITVVVDDCSKEDLKSVIDKYNDLLQIVYLRNETNGGPGVSRQHGLDWCYEHNIEYVMFLDSDDCLMPQTIDRLGYEIKHNLGEMLISGITVEHTNRVPSFIKPENNSCWMHGKIYSALFLQQNDIRFDPELRTNEDMTFNLLCSGYAKKKFNLNEYLYLWRDAKSSITRKAGTTEYNNVRSFDQIRGVYRMYKHFMQHKRALTNDVCSVILNTYNYYQNGVCLCKEAPQDINDKLTEMLNHPNVVNTVNAPKRWSSLSLKQYYYDEDNDKILIYPQTFIQWFTNFSVLGNFKTDNETEDTEWKEEIKE